MAETVEQLRARLLARLFVVKRKLKRSPMNESYAAEWESIERKLRNLQPPPSFATTPSDPR